jgi:hypothetical protein
MGARKKNPGAGGTGASRNRRKKSPRNSRKRKRAQPFAPRTQCWMYSGLELLATFVTTHTGSTRAFGADRRSLGRFPTFRAAITAINEGAV